MAPANWYSPLARRQSLAQTSPRPGSLAGLAAARELTLAQYFTPQEVAAFMWSIVKPAIDDYRAMTEGERVSLFDNSVGTGRLFQFADPEAHSLHGVDVHADSVNALSEASIEAGFVTDFQVRSMESIRPRGYHVALINPPFSITFDSPLLKPYRSNTFGLFGPASRAISHRYALEQALDAARLVVALLPRTFAIELLQDQRDARPLRACFHLPANSFCSEGTSVDVSVMVFCHGVPRNAEVHQLNSLAPCSRSLGLVCAPLRSATSRLGPLDLDDREPVIRLPVNGDRRVRITRHGPLLRLQFRCGLTQARVMNGILRGRVVRPSDTHRHPRGVLYSGQGQLDLEVHLAQENPKLSFEALARSIESFGGVVEWDPSLLGYLRRRLAHLPVEQCPLRRTIYDRSPSGSRFVAQSRQTFCVDVSRWGAPVFRARERVDVRRDGDCFVVTRKAKAEERIRFTADEFRVRFESEAAAVIAEGWRVVQSGRAARFPQRAAWWRMRAQRLGIDRWLWAYQLDDLIEVFMTPGGEVIAWEQGTGKARLSAAIALLSGAKHVLICVEAFLVDEMERELRGLPLPSDCWQFIRGPAQLATLRTINVITYNRLRGPLNSDRSKHTYAKALRRRCSVVVADEGDLLANRDTAQTRALLALAAKRRFVLTGTPIGNYPRDLLPLLAFAKGNGTATQPYGFPVRRGMERPYITPHLIENMSACVRGVDQFRENFVVTEWVTNEFATDLQRGAKREIPKIANLSAYRDLLSRHVKRRLTAEPDVAKETRIPQPTYLDHVIEWDPEHLRYYLDVSREFAHWYRETQLRAGHCGKAVNLVTLLARIQAVQAAANNPQEGVNGFGAFTPLTSKQRAIVDRVCSLAEERKRMVVFMDNPNAVEVIARALRDRRIDPVVMHGQRPIDERTEELNRRFRDGDCPVVVATYGVTSKGLNLWQASVALLANRCWTASREAQAARRLCRPQQTQAVTVERFHLRGSIDEYQGQMVAFKQDAADAGLDFAAPTLDGIEFLHLDTLLGRFCEALEELAARTTSPRIAAAR